MSWETSILQTLHEVSSGNNIKQKDIIKRVKKIHQQKIKNSISKTDDGGDASSSAFDKKAVKKILKKLVKSGTIALVDGEAKMYCCRALSLPSSVSKSNATNTKLRSRAISGDSDSSSGSKELNMKNEKPLPLAESLRRRKKGLDLQEEPAKQCKEEGAEDIDDEIRRLEAELAADSDSSGDSEDDDNGDSDDEEDIFGDQGNPGDAGVISLSTLAADRIAALPETFLPTNKRRTLKIDKMVAGEVSSKEPKVKRRKKSSDAARANGSDINISDGLRAAVKEVLDGYKPRSNEKIPFYCRVCAKQYKSSDEFFDHKKGDFHKAAVELEKKASYCKLCRKQLTSPAQLKEHLYSKPHKERLQLMKSRQPPRKR